MIIGMWVDKESDILFNVSTPLGFSVRTTRRYWYLNVIAKHSVMSGREDDVEDALRDPDEVRVSRKDSEAFLFYRTEYPGRWVCAVVKRLNSNEGFLITAYPTDAIKKGDLAWSG